MIDERNVLLKNSEDPKTKEKIDDLGEKIADEEAEANRSIIMKNFKEISEDPENINLKEMWRSCKKLWPKSGVTVPTAKRNTRGKIVTGPREIRNVLAEEYKNRLRSRPVRPDLQNMKNRKQKIFEMKMKLAEENVSLQWNMKDLDLALANLKINKSRDFEGLINEVFKNNVIGSDLKKSLLKMFNSLKTQRLIPEFMNFANITTVPKKGSRIEPTNERGIFRVSVLRSILMRLIYNTKYPVINENMSDCQMGGRKKKSSKNNLFIINGIIHETLKAKIMKPICLLISDYKQMFDAMSLEEALSDLFDVGVNDDTLKLLYEANRDIHMAVKTPSGLTERQVITNCVLQGDTWGSMLASVQVDSIGKECMERDFSYKFKEQLPIGFL